MKKSVMALLAAATLLGGCAQPVHYGSSFPGLGDVVTDMTNNVTNFGDNDLEKLSSKMVNKMLSSSAVRSITGGVTPIVVVDSIKNKTREHVDTASLTESIRSDLRRSGQFRSVDPARVKAVRKQLHFGLDDRFVNQSTAIQFGNMVGAQYMLYGHVSTTMKPDGAYYKIMMRLMDLKSGVIEWSGSDVIRQPSNNTNWQ